MLPARITRQNIFRALLGGFSLVILLLVTATIVGIRNIQSIQENTNNLVAEQARTNGLIDELQSQQTELSEVFSVLARDPDSVDYYKIMAQLDEADRDIARISEEGSHTSERELWLRLNRSALNFSGEARRLLSIEYPETFASMDLFRYHGAFTGVVARLLESEYRKLNQAQTQIEGRTARLRDNSLLFSAASALLALVFTVLTVRMVARLVAALESQTAELGRVSWQMLENQEEAARRFSHELHDELGQSLTAVKTNLSALAADSGTAQARLPDCLHLVDEAIGNVRQLSQLLRPTILDDFGLEAGLRWLAEGFATRTGIEVAVESSLAERLPDETETHLFRIAQEALSNVARHAEAKHVWISLSEQAGQIRLRIQDDGRGLPEKEAPGARGLGLIGMRARARSAGGDATVESRPGEGVLIEVRIPGRHETHTNPAG